MLSFRHIICLNLSTMRLDFSTWVAKDAALRQVSAFTKTSHLLLQPTPSDDTYLESYKGLQEIGRAHV